MEDRAKGENEAADAEEIKHFARRVNGGRRRRKRRRRGEGRKGYNFRFFRGRISRRQCSLGTAILGATDPENTARDYRATIACFPPACLSPRLRDVTLFARTGTRRERAERCETKVSGKMVPLRENEGRR